MKIHKLKKYLMKAAAGIVTVLMVAVLFVLQFVVFENNLYFWKDISFWFNLALMLAILVICAELYWRFGGQSGQRNEKYLNSAIEYSLRVNRIKNSNPNKVDDFYKFIDEKNIELFEEGRKNFLDQNGIRREDYYGNGEENNVAHKDMTKKELIALTKESANGKVQYYTKKQVKSILRAKNGAFPYEKMNGTEILSGMTIKASRYNVHYNARENQIKFSTKSLMIAVMLALIGAVLVPQLRESWTPATIFLFLYRVFVLAYRAFMSWLEGYNDIVETRRAINNNRINVVILYVSVRNIESLYDGLDTEIVATKKAYAEELKNG